jgi:TorA maturation chaperone TorD
MTIDMTELSDLIAHQNHMYLFLAHLYRMEVDQPLLDGMKNMDLDQETGNEQMDEGYRLLKTFLSDTSPDTLSDLAVDYARVFLGAGLEPGTGAFPYESVYTSERRLLMQEARDAVVESFKQAEMVIDENIKEPEDHISFELEFLSHLGRMTIESLEMGENDCAIGHLVNQNNFLQQHLLPWVPEFCQDIDRLAQSDFYRAISHITLGYLKLESELNSQLISTIESAMPGCRIH